jgi:hypothetical protein
MVIVFVALAAAQPPPAAMLFVIVYVPGVLVERSISPVALLVKTKPVDELNTPALDPVGNVGRGSAAL